MPGAHAGPHLAQQGAGVAAGAKQASSREARLSGSRWSSTQSTPLVMVSTSSTVVPS